MVDAGLPRPLIDELDNARGGRNLQLREACSVQQLVGCTEDARVTLLPPSMLHCLMPSA